MKEFKLELQRTMRKSGFELTDAQLGQFVTYRNELKRWNEKINLTSIKDDKGIIEKHFLDSVAILAYFNIPFSAKVADVGSGAGFPGLPLKVLRPDLDLVLIESAKKKASFLNFIIATLRLTNVEVANVRAEEFIRLEPDNKFEVVLTRFLASIVDSVEYCVKLLKNKGVFVAYKGPDAQTEIESAKPKIKNLDAEVIDLIKSDITKYNRYFVLIRKKGKSISHNQK